MTLVRRAVLPLRAVLVMAFALLVVFQVLSMPGRDAAAKVANWLGRDDASLRFTMAMLNELAAQKSMDYPTASVAVQRLSQLASRG